MSMWAEYIKERQDAESLESDIGFVTYQINKTECFINDMYVKPEYRKSNKASDLIRQLSAIAKAAGCTEITATVCPSANNSTQALHAALHIGFRLKASGNNYVLISKEIA